MAVAADASASASVASGGAMAAEAEAEAEETVEVSGGGLHEHTMRAQKTREQRGYDPGQVHHMGSPIFGAKAPPLSDPPSWELSDPPPK